MAGKGKGVVTSGDNSGFFLGRLSHLGIKNAHSFSGMIEGATGYLKRTHHDRIERPEARPRLEWLAI